MNYFPTYNVLPEILQGHRYTDSSVSMQMFLVQIFTFEIRHAIYAVSNHPFVFHSQEGSYIRTCPSVYSFKIYEGRCKMDQSKYCEKKRLSENSLKDPTCIQVLLHQKIFQVLSFSCNSFRISFSKF